MREPVKWEKKYLKKILLGGIILAAAGIGLAVAAGRSRETVQECWWEIPVVAHAGGGIDGKVNSNSLEAMNQTAENGYHMVEVDFALTSDGKLVLSHGWDEDSADTLEIPEGTPDLETFLATKIHRKYTPMTAEDLIEWMKKHKAIYIVTDTKCKDPEEMKHEFELLAELCAYDPGLLERFVVQIYDVESYDAVMSVYEFPNVMYATYQSACKEVSYWQQVAKDCTARNIQMVSVPRDYVSTRKHPVTLYMEILKDAGLRVCVHPVNSITDMERMLDAGADSIMSDFLYEDDLQYLQE